MLDRPATPPTPGRRQRRRTSRLGLSTSSPLGTPALLQSEVREWLSERRWTHFLTLMFNDPCVRIGTMGKKLRDWDARMNRALLGGRWLKRPDERLQWVAFPEKLDANPHWHLCLEVEAEQVEKMNRYYLGTDAFADAVEAKWTKLVPSGTVDVQPYRDTGALHYATKDLHRSATLENFVTAFEFIRK